MNFAEIASIGGKVTCRLESRARLRCQQASTPFFADFYCSQEALMEDF
jgi:hypothetical protein